MRGKRITAGALLAIALSVAGGLLFRNRPQQFVPEEVALARAAQRQFAHLPRVPASDETAVAQAIADARPIPGQFDVVTPDDALRRSLAQTLAQWIRFRADMDPAGYSAWMRLRGCRLWLETTTDDDELPVYSMQLDTRSEQYAYFMGEPVPPGITPQRLHDVFFEKSLSCYGTQTILPSYLVSGDGAAAVYKRIGPGGSPTPLESWEGSELWFGLGTIGGYVQWRPPITLDEVIERDGDALTASVALATQSPRGGFAPLGITLYYDPDTKLWHFKNLTLSNVEEWRCAAGVY